MAMRRHFMFNEIINQNQRNIVRIQRRNLRDNSDPFLLPDDQFISIFRLPKHLVQNLIEDLHPCLNRMRNSSIAVALEVLAALHFYATGNKFNVKKKFIGVLPHN